MSARDEPVPLALLPDTAEIGAAGHLSVGGCDLAEVAAEFGTPLFVYDEEHLRRRCREALDAFGDGVAYACKAFLCIAMARLVHEEGLHLDVASGGELATAVLPHAEAKYIGEAQRRTQLAEGWPALRAALLDRGIPTAAEVWATLQAAGAPSTFAELGVSRPDGARTLRVARDIRIRVTVLDVAFGLGVLPDAIPAVIDASGV